MSFFISLLMPSAFSSRWQQYSSTSLQKSAESRNQASRFLKWCLTLLLLLELLLNCAQADVLDADSIYYGKIFKVTATKVFFDYGCDPRNRLVFEKTTIKRIFTNAKCDADFSVPPPPPLVDCDRSTPGYIATLKDMPNQIEAEDFSVVDGKAAFKLIGGVGALYAKSDDVKEIRKEEICLGTKTEHFSPGALTGSVCYEPTQWAVNWSPDPVYRNDIFTKGFSFFLQPETASGAQASSIPDVRLAFGTAMTMWITALNRVKDQLDAELQKYITGITSCSSKYCLITPPQVVQSSCKENTMFLVEWVSKVTDIFTASESNYVAKAHLEGRTVFVNARNRSFRSDLVMRKVKDKDTVNLATILAHELGHAFGLMDEASGTSIMSSNMKNIALEPTNEDALRLASILKQNIKGAKAGEFNPTACAGLSE